MSEKLRPRFRYYIPQEQSEIAKSFKNAFAKDDCIFRGSTLDYHISVDFIKSKRHFWTPQMDLNLEKYEDGTLIRGLIGPRAAIWTVFMFFYTLAGLLGLGGVIIGSTQLSMNEYPAALWLIPFSLAIFLVVYLLGQTGKRIGSSDSVQLHEFLLQNIPEPIELEIVDL